MGLSRLIPGRLREGGRLLHVREFRNVFLAQSVSVFGDGITPVALTFAVLDLTGSGTDLGLVLAAQSVPLVALSLVGGVWADRLPRAALMMAKISASSSCRRWLTTNCPWCNLPSKDQ